MGRKAGILYLLQQAGDFLLKAVQKEQTREFNRRLYENKKSGNQTEAVKQLEEQQRRNAKAEKLLDENLKTLGVDITNVGDLNEKLTFFADDGGTAAAAESHHCQYAPCDPDGEQDREPCQDRSGCFQ